MKSKSWRSKCRKILSALFSRLLFGVHAFIMITMFAMVDEKYLYMLFIILLLFIEMIITLAVTEKGEWKWFSPMVFIYLCSVIPLTFKLELGIIEYRQQVINSVTNITNSSDIRPEEIIKWYPVILQISEQLLIIVLVIGRWLMPKGDLNREQLSQLLIIYLGLGADILDLLQLIKEQKVSSNRTVAIVGLCIFCWTITQFTAVLTQDPEEPKSRKASVTEESLSLSEIKPEKTSPWCHSEVQSFLITTAMQDGPFLAYRVYVLIVIGEVTDSIVFFTCKNFLTLTIESYRLAVLLIGNRKKYERDKLKITRSNTSELGV